MSGLSLRTEKFALVHDVVIQVVHADDTEYRVENPLQCFVLGSANLSACLCFGEMNSHWERNLVKGN